jgi:hypothetical protein
VIYTSLKGEKHGKVNARYSLVSAHAGNPRYQLSSK